MKRFIILVTLLLCISFVGLFAETTVGGEFQYFTDFESGSFTKVELNITGAIDEYNTVKLELDSEGGAFTGTDVVTASGDPDTTTSLKMVQVDDFRLVSDITGALMLDLPITIKGTFGFFDTYFTGWNYVSESGWEFYYDWPNVVVTQGPKTVGAMQLDIGIDPITLHWWNDFAFDNIMIGADGAFGPVNFYAAMGAPTDDFGGGQISVEVKYALDAGGISLGIPVFFGMNMGADTMTYGLGVSGDIDMIHFAVGVEGDDADALDNVVVDVSATPIDGLTAKVNAYMDLAADDSFTGLNISAQYKFGAMTLIGGYAYTAEGLTIPVYSDSWATSGVYIGVDVDY
jgi:hypothetical protein